MKKILLLVLLILLNISLFAQVSHRKHERDKRQYVKRLFNNRNRERTLEILSRNVCDFGFVAISFLGNSKAQYPTNSVAETYWGIKVGFGPGVGGSYAPKTRTSFLDWIPQVPYHPIIWK